MTPTRDGLLKLANKAIEQGETETLDTENIVSLYPHELERFTALLSINQAQADVSEMVNKFLGWKLPKDFCPDAGISFKPTKPYEGDEYGNSWWPIGTNLLSADQARAMFLHCLPAHQAQAEPQPAGEYPPLPHQQLDALLDHIYEYGTAAEGIAERAEAMLHTYADADRATRAHQAQAEPEKPVAFVDVIDSYEGPYKFDGLELLPVGKHLLYTAPPSSDQTWNEAIAAAAAICDAQATVVTIGGEGEYNDGRSMAATVCASMIRDLARPSQAQEPVKPIVITAISNPEKFIHQSDVQPVSAAVDAHIQDILFAVYDYAQIADGIDSAVGNTRSEQKKAMWLKAAQIRRMISALSRAQQAPAHPDDIAVDRFADAMKAKLAQKRADGYGGWDDPSQCTIESLESLLRFEANHKGDPVDVANFAMMVHQHSIQTAAAPVSEQTKCASCGYKKSHMIHTEFGAHAFVAPVSEQQQPDNSRGFALHASREEWGAIFDGLMLELDRSKQRKAANTASNSDERGRMCADLLNRINVLSGLQAGHSKAAPVSGQTKEQPQ